MSDPSNPTVNDKKKYQCHTASGAAGGVYGLAFIGALVYFLQQSTGFTASLVGFLKALVWPAILVYELLQFLNS